MCVARLHGQARARLRRCSARSGHGAAARARKPPSTAAHALCERDAGQGAQRDESCHARHGAPRDGRVACARACATSAGAWPSEAEPPPAAEHANVSRDARRLVFRTATLPTARPSTACYTRLLTRAAVALVARWGTSMGADEELAGFQCLPATATDGSYGACEEPRVRIARIGELPHGGSSKLSRDGSVHVTDEARQRGRCGSPWQR